LTRFELELRRDKCKHFRAEYLTDTAKLFEIFKHEVFWINYQFLKFVHTEDAERCAYSHLIEPFSDKSLFNMTAGESKRRAVERLEHVVEYGKPLKDVNR